MMHNLIRAIIAGMCLALICSCSEDRIIKNEAPSPYQDLKEKDDILFNLELSYNERDIYEFGKLLAQEFWFYFARTDYLAGKTPEKWNRANELVATDHIFNIPEDSTAIRIPILDNTPRRSDAGTINVTWGQLKAIEMPAKSLALNFAYITGDSTWTAFAPPDTSSFAGEAWYWKDVSLDLTILTPDDHTYYALDNVARFYIRFSLVEGDSIWQIIEWDDLGPRE